MQDKGLTKNLQTISSRYVCLSYSARCFTSVLTRGKFAAIMVNLTYVGLLLGWKGMLRKFSFVATCFYSLEKWLSLLEIVTNSALFHSRDPMYTLRRWSSVFDINNHKFWLSTFVNRNAIHRCIKKVSHLKGSETSEANNSRVTRARLLWLQICKRWI